MIDLQTVLSSDSLPTLPAVAVRMLEFSRNPETEITDVVAVIRTDPAISAKIMRATNSSFFGLQKRVTSVERAVPLLGTNVVTSLALSFSLVENAMSSGPLAAHFRDYWRQSVVQGCAAEVIGNHLEEGLGSECFLTGLLLDLGRLAMLKTIPEDYTNVLDVARESRRPLHVVEQELLGIDHVEVGIGLMERWDLPAVLIEAARVHHGSEADLEGIVKGDTSSLASVAAVAAVTGELFCTTNNGPALERLVELGASHFSLSEDEVHEFAAAVRDRVDEASELFSIDTSQIGCPSELMARANEHLAQLAMRAHAATAQAEARKDLVESEKRQLEEQNRELKKRSVRDPLTELYNRRFFEETLRNEIERSRRMAAPVAVLFSDIDHFKTLNDTYGHQFGDDVLVHVARTFGEVMRKSDVVARYGGEEFVVLVLNPTEKALQSVTERLRARVEALPLECAGRPVKVTVSIGAAWAVPGKREDDLDERIVAEADAAMYEAKRGGRNRVEIHSLLSSFELQLARIVTAARFSRWLVGQRIFEIPTLSRALLAFKPGHVVVGDLALESGMLSNEEVQRVLDAQRVRPECRFGEIAHDLGLLTIEQVGWLLAQQQEPSDELAQLLVRKGLVEPDRAAELTEAYLATAPRLVPAAPVA